MKSTLRGIFLTSRSPEKTASFYRDVAGLDLEEIGTPGAYVYWKVDRDGMQLAIHDAEKFASYAYPPLQGSNLTHLYFKVESQAEFLAYLSRLKIEPLATDEVVVTIVDPDGRKVMFGTA